MGAPVAQLCQMATGMASSEEKEPAHSLVPRGGQIALLDEVHWGPVAWHDPLRPG
jgi:hypothetical protein